MVDCESKTALSIGQRYAHNHDKHVATAIKASR